MKAKVLLLSLLSPLFLVAQTPKAVNKKILVVVSSYGKNEGKHRPGYEFEEFSQAWLIFKANGLEVDVASPKGGHAEPDAFNKSKPYNKLVVDDANAMTLLRNTIPTALVNPEQYAAIYIVGGKGAMFDLPFDPSLQDIILHVYEKQQGIVAAVCHGPAVLANIKLADGRFLVAGKIVSGFSNEEEKKFGKTWVTEFPFLLEGKLKSRGATYESSKAMLPQVSIDGRLITGQNPFSTTGLADAIVKAIGMKPVKRELYSDERSMYFVKRALQGDSIWARQEIKVHHAMYDTELIAVYGYYQLIKGDGSDAEIRSALQLIELVTAWVLKENLYYEMAKGYLQLKNKVRARELLQEVLAKNPTFAAAKKLLDEIK